MQHIDLKVEENDNLLDQYTPLTDVIVRNYDANSEFAHKPRNINLFFYEKVNIFNNSFLNHKPQVNKYNSKNMKQLLKGIFLNLFVFGVPTIITSVLTYVYVGATRLRNLANAQKELNLITSNITSFCNDESLLPSNCSNNIENCYHNITNCYDNFDSLGIPESMWSFALNLAFSYYGCNDYIERNSSPSNEEIIPPSLVSGFFLSVLLILNCLYKKSLYSSPMIYTPISNTSEDEENKIIDELFFIFNGYKMSNKVNTTEIEEQLNSTQEIRNFYHDRYTLFSHAVSEAKIDLPQDVAKLIFSKFDELVLADVTNNNSALKR